MHLKSYKILVANPKGYKHRRENNTKIMSEKYSMKGKAMVFWCKIYPTYLQSTV